SIRIRVRVAPGTSARVAFWTIVADTREALIDLVDKHHDHTAFERAKTLAWTQAQVQLRHLGMQADEAAAFQRLSAALHYPDSWVMASTAMNSSEARSPTGFRAQALSRGISNVMPRIDGNQDRSMVKHVLSALRYWSM